MKRFATLFVILAAVSLVAHAQAARWQLVRAEYGAGHTWVDVTSRVASLIHGNSLDITVNNDTLGGDPAHGAQKTLRLRVRNESRREEVLSYHEKDTISLSISTSSAGFDPDEGRREYRGGSRGLQILRADYGTQNHFADVTARLNSQIQNNTLSLRITNDTMGGDPAPDRPKQLSVVYIYNGQQCRAMINEKDTLNLPSAGDCAGNSYGDGFQILQATYGVGDRRRDVTDRVAALVSGQQLQLQVSNSTMGGDPAEGQRKQLRVIYLWQGIRYEAITPEGAALSIP